VDCKLHIDPALRAGQARTRDAFATMASSGAAGLVALASKDQPGEKSAASQEESTAPRSEANV